MQTKRINLLEKRTFSDELTITFQFIKQEFKSLIKAFSAIVLPLIFVELFLQSFLLRDILGGAARNAFADGGSGWTTMLVNYLLAIFVFAWLQLFVLSYLRLYTDKYLQQEEIKISFLELLKVMGRNSGLFFVLGIVYLFYVVMGCVIFILPGIYISVIFIFSSCFLIIRDRKLFSAFASSADLCRGQWWNIFGYILLCSLIVSMLGYVFNLPYLGIFLEAYLTGNQPGLFELTLVNSVGIIGRYLMNIVFIVGIGVRFFSRLERKEHRTLLDKIGQIGTEERTESGEDGV